MMEHLRIGDFQKERKKMGDRGRVRFGFWALAMVCICSRNALTAEEIVAEPQAADEPD